MAITRHGNKRDASLLAGSSGKKQKQYGQHWLGHGLASVGVWGVVGWPCSALASYCWLVVARPPPPDFKHGWVLASKDPLKRFKRSKVQVIFVGNG